MSTFKERYRENQNNPKAKKKGCFSCLGCFGILVLMFGFLVMTSLDKEEKANEAMRIEQQAVLSENGISEEQYANIKDVVESVGLELEHLKKDEFMNDYVEPGDIGFILNNTDEPGAPMTLLVIKADKTVQRIVYRGAALYENDTAVDNASNYSLTAEERSTYETMAMEHVKSALNFPETAKFSLLDGFAMDKSQGNVTVQGTVESQNALGVSIKSKFQIIYNTDAVPTSLIIDGRELIQQ